MSALSPITTEKRRSFDVSNVPIPDSGVQHERHPPAPQTLRLPWGDGLRTRPPELAAFRLAPWARAAIACSRNACTRRRRSEALTHTRPIRLAKEEASGTGSLASDKPSGHGGA